MNISKFKQHLLDELYAPYVNCQMCPLAKLGRTHVVFGEGNPDARLLFIGEAPGESEDRQGRPFVGRSGMLLTRALEKFNIQRSDVYIANVVKCRPPNNRLPDAIESNTCKEILLFKQIKIIRPDVICTLGSCSLNALFDQVIKITKMRGQELDLHGIKVIPTYHPAYILRNNTQAPYFLEDINKALTIAKLIENTAT